MACTSNTTCTYIYPSTCMRKTSSSASLLMSCRPAAAVLRIHVQDPSADRPVRSRLQGHSIDRISCTCTHGRQSSVYVYKRTCREIARRRGKRSESGPPLNVVGRTHTSRTPFLISILPLAELSRKRCPICGPPETFPPGQWGGVPSVDVRPVRVLFIYSQGSPSLFHFPRRHHGRRGASPGSH